MRERLRVWQRKYYFERRRRDQAFKLKQDTSTAIRNALKGRASYSKNSLWWEKPCGYTVAELRRHLENQFTDGMTWENHGKLWEIDHIKPLSAFDAPNARCAEFKAAWALSNLRPLLSHLNRAKGAKRL